MTMQKTEEKRTSRGFARRRFAWAIAATLLSQGVFCLANDGVRELRNPAELDTVAPVRAIGIRLMPAVPFDPLTNKPHATESELKHPERIRPKPKVALTSTDKQLIQSVQIEPQAPIRLSFSNSNASLASASTTAAETEGDRGVNMPVKVAISVPARATSHPTAVPEALPILVAPAPPVFTDGASRPLDIHDPEPMPSVAAPEGLPAAMETDFRVDKVPMPTEKRGSEAIPLRFESPRSTPKPSYTAEQLERAIAVELESQNAREILLDVPVDRILVSDEKVCRAMASDGRVYLVGLELGESTIEVKPRDGMESRLLQVKVVAPWQRSHGAMDLNQLVHAIQPLSPNGNLSIQAGNDGSLVVRGNVDSKETAKRIMEVIRKLILVPVVDKLDIL